MIQTPNQAYIIGFITGDGTIFNRKKSKRLVLSLAEQDKQLLFDIGKELNMEAVIKFRRKNAENEQNKYSLTINSTKMCNDLIAMGIGPRKTGFEKWIDFNDEKLQWAFIRGFFDADGHVGMYGRKNELVRRVGFTGNLNMLFSLLEYAKSYDIGKRVNTISAKQGCYDLSISSRSDLKKCLILCINMETLNLIESMKNSLL